MKAITLLLVLFAFNSFAQQQLYTANKGVYMDEATLRSIADTIRKTIPPSHDVKGIIYHKVFKKDTVINFFAFEVVKKAQPEQPVPARFKIEFKQDYAYLLINKKLPYFKLKDMSGTEVTSTDLAGKPTLLNFWAIYCGPCVAEMPDLSKLKEKYKDKVNFVSITENDAVQDDLFTFLKNKNFNFRVLQNGYPYKKELSLGAIPKNIFIDRNGIVRNVQGNYPLNGNMQPLAIDDKDNYFVKMIDLLISEKD